MRSAQQQQILGEWLFSPAGFNSFLSADTMLYLTKGYATFNLYLTMASQFSQTLQVCVHRF